MKTCSDCGKSILNRGKTAIRCLDCARKQEKLMNKNRMLKKIDVKGKDFYREIRKFQKKVHALQGDSCVVCGFNAPNSLYGGCDAHHIIPLSEGGANDPYNNGAVLCRNCHVLAHKGNISIEQLKKDAGVAKIKRGRMKIDSTFIDRMRAKA